MERQRDMCVSARLAKVSERLYSDPDNFPTRYRQMCAKQWSICVELGGGLTSACTRPMLRVVEIDGHTRFEVGFVAEALSRSRAGR